MVMAFLFAEIENRLSEDLPQADFGLWQFFWKISAVGKDQVKAEILQVENYAHCSFL